MVRVVLTDSLIYEKGLQSVTVWSTPADTLRTWAPILTCNHKQSSQALWHKLRGTVTVMG